MPAPLLVTLTEAQSRDLRWACEHHALPYLRERAAAILKIATEHLSGREVAHHRLLKPHAPDTIYDWVKRFQAEGLTGLRVRPGRGRKPAFSPSVHHGRERPRRPAAYRTAGSPRTGS